MRGSRCNNPFVLSLSMIISASEANLSESSTDGILNSSDEAMPAIMSSNS